MEKMLNEYLQFSSESNKEQTEKFEINDLIENTISKFNNDLIKFNKGEEFLFNGRKLSIQRCLNNLIENSTKFANKIEINFQKLKK